MNRQTIPLGRIMGIPIGLDYFWFLIFALLTWMLAGSYYPSEFKNWPPVYPKNLKSIYLKQLTYAA